MFKNIIFDAIYTVHCTHYNIPIWLHFFRVQKPLAGWHVAQRCNQPNIRLMGVTCRNVEKRGGRVTYFAVWWGERNKTFCIDMLSFLLSVWNHHKNRYQFIMLGHNIIFWINYFIRLKGLEGFRVPTAYTTSVFINKVGTYIHSITCKYIIPYHT